MKINPAIQACAEQGLLLVTEDAHVDKKGRKTERLVCHIYVKPIMDIGAQLVRLCSWSELYHMSRADFAARLAELPREAGVA